MTTSPDLIERIRAAIDRTEQLARAALRNPCRYDLDLHDYVDTGVDDGVWEADGCEVVTANPPAVEGCCGGIHIYDEGGHSVEQAQHIAHNDPDAVSRRCAADRKILDRHQPERRRLALEDDGGTTHLAFYICVVCTPNRRIEIGQAIVEWPCPDILDRAEAYGITTGDQP